MYTTGLSAHVYSMTKKMLKELGTELGLDRYKYVVQVVIGEQRGEGVK